VIEIQTGNFASIKRKVRDLSCRYHVTLIYPVAQERWILEVPRTLPGAIVRRKSPKSDAVDQLFEELVSFPDLLKCPNFSIEVVSTQEEQLRSYDKRRPGKRRAWRIVERKLLRVLERFLFDVPSDLWQLIPSSLPDAFETSQLASAVGRPRCLLSSIQCDKSSAPFVFSKPALSAQRYAGKSHRDRAAVCSDSTRGRVSSH
jgi:hypothetical protein